MEKDETPKHDKTEKHHRELPQLHQRLKKALIYSLLFLVFIGGMWVIFAPSEKTKEKQAKEKGFNTVIPQPKKDGIIGDKQTAYEHEQVEEKQKERNQTMQDLASLFGSSKESLSENNDLNEPKVDQKSSQNQAKPQSAIYSSASAYKEINHTLSTFYQTPNKDTEKEEPKQKDELSNSQLEKTQTPKSNIDEQIALMEKSYELAAKYIPQSVGSKGPQTENQTTKGSNILKNNNAKPISVSRVSRPIVSTLNQPVAITNQAPHKTQIPNMSFHTAVGTNSSDLKNTIKACVYENQTITDGQTVRMRLLEPMSVGTTIIPLNSLIIGISKLQGERLDIIISSLEYNGTIIPVELSVFDTDGQQGIFIPGSMEMNAVKEVAANMGSSLGTSISITQSAGQQVAADLSKGALQGTSQYLSKKIQAVRVHLKAGYTVMLFTKQNQ
jgi:conjugative transposon TraM protein